MIKFLNFLYKGLEYSDPRYGPKGAFWLMIFSFILCPLDTIIIAAILSSNLEDLSLLWILFTTLVRLVPFFYVKPSIGQKPSRLYIYDKKKTYILNAIVAVTILLISVPFPVWLYGILVNN